MNDNYYCVCSHPESDHSQQDVGVEGCLHVVEATYYFKSNMPDKKVLCPCNKFRHKDEGERDGSEY